MSAGNVTLAQPLAPGGSIHVQYLFGIQQTGCYRIGLFAESLPTGGSDLFVVAGNTDGPNENCRGSADADADPNTIANCYSDADAQPDAVRGK